MKTDQLVVHFTDGTAAGYSVDYNKRLVVMDADDDETQQRYRLTFAGCERIFFFLEVQLDDIEGDIYNLLDIRELGIDEDKDKGVVSIIKGLKPCRNAKAKRMFRIGFEDGALEISCAQFTIESIHGYNTVDWEGVPMVLPPKQDAN